MRNNLNKREDLLWIISKLEMTPTISRGYHYIVHPRSTLSASANLRWDIHLYGLKWMDVLRFTKASCSSRIGKRETGFRVSSNLNKCSLKKTVIKPAVSPAATTQNRIAKIPNSRKWLLRLVVKLVINKQRPDNVSTRRKMLIRIMRKERDGKALGIKNIALLNIEVVTYTHRTINGNHSEANRKGFQMT